MVYIMNIMTDYAWLLKVVLLCCIKCFEIAHGTHPDEILHLPGVNFTLGFRQYSGYLSGGGGKKLHYWFVESSNFPPFDPVVLWLNGGPGCSSLEGFFAELGPIHIKDDEKTPYLNPYSWNQVANVLFLESPVGVGFSYSEDNQYATSDGLVAEENYMAIQSFFKKFPQFKENDFYLTGESYAGVYIPTLSEKILDGIAEINYKGFAIGNGAFYSEKMTTYYIFYCYYHGLIGFELMSTMSVHCCDGFFTPDACNFETSKNRKCHEAIYKFSRNLNNLHINIYNIYGHCYQSDYKFSRYEMDKKFFEKDFSHSRHMYEDFISHHHIMGNHGQENKTSIPESISLTGVGTHGQENKTSNPKSSFTCDRTLFRNYLNEPSVRAALHIPTHVQNWEVCRPLYYLKEYTNMSPQISKALNAGKRGLIYYGDMDLIVNFVGGLMFSPLLNLKNAKEYTSWRYEGQIGGYVQYYSNDFTYLIVRGAGHMVPQDQPGPSLKMISSFLNNVPY